MGTTPFGLEINFQNGLVSTPNVITERRLSQVRRVYRDQAAVDRILSDEGDRLVYQVYGADLPEDEGQVLYCTTIIQPGTVGGEYHMTKGHYHARRDRGEVYLGLAGEGMLLLMLEDGTLRSIPMHPGTAAHIPPYWAHRTVNTGNVPFVFFSAWPGDAGHDYGTIEDTGFADLVVEAHGKPALIPNPRFPRKP